MDFLDFNDFSPTVKKGCRYILVVIQKFSEFGWTVPMKSEYAPAKKSSSENFFVS